MDIDMEKLIAGISKAVEEKFDEKLWKMKEEILDEVKGDTSEKAEKDIQVDIPKSNYKNIAWLQKMKEDDPKRYDQIVSDAPKIPEYERQSEEIVKKMMSRKTEWFDIWYVVCIESSNTLQVNGDGNTKKNMTDKTYKPLIETDKNKNEIVYIFEKKIDAAVQAAYFKTKYPKLQKRLGYKLMGV